MVFRLPHVHVEPHAFHKTLLKAAGCFIYTSSSARNTLQNNSMGRKDPLTVQLAGVVKPARPPSPYLQNDESCGQKYLWYKALCNTAC
mmetsp:Transcript_24141/g.52749  ORF Transcript_24141/g.52749 Transcript_24141/m.52749 type:complete len:88 (+) Transcript_24141:958-1221(+)